LAPHGSYASGYWNGSEARAVYWNGNEWIGKLVNEPAASDPSRPPTTKPKRVATEEGRAVRKLKVCADALETLRKLHAMEDGNCYECGGHWPCPTVKVVLAAIETLAEG
jgi:hypothetical protein